jgi:hypothetical protein
VERLNLGVQLEKVRNHSESIAVLASITNDGTAVHATVATAQTGAGEWCSPPATVASFVKSCVNYHAGRLGIEVDKHNVRR